MQLTYNGPRNASPIDLGMDPQKVGRSCHSPQVILKCLAFASVPAVSKFAAADQGSVQQVGAVLLSILRTYVLGGQGAALTVTSLRHHIRVSRYIPTQVPTYRGR